jgi:cation diffusion facilitator family transporter
MNVERKDPRRRAIARILWVTLGLNLLVATAKLVFGQLSGSLAITADGLHSLLDGSSNVIGLVGVGVAGRPPDDNHPYGHRKYETFAALGVAALMLLGGREIAFHAWERMQHPVTPHIMPVAFAIMTGTMAVNLVVVAIERRGARRLGSELLQSDSAHTLSDVYATLLVITSLAAQRLGVGWADLAATGVILLLILKAGIHLLRTTLSTLSDERRIAPAEIEQVAALEPGVLEAHNVRSRGPQDDVHVDLHVLVDPGTLLAEAHAIGHRVEQRLRERFPGVTDVVVHVEPALEDERATRREGGGLRARG